MKISSPLISYFKISNRLLAITVLLLAAGLKWHQLITSPYTGNMVLESRLITAALVAAEIALAGWLISGVQAKMARWTAVAAFFVFLLATLRRLWKGDASCGCFGIVEVSPLITAVLDVIVIWSLALPVASECTVGKGDLNDLLGETRGSSRWKLAQKPLNYWPIASAASSVTLIIFLSLTVWGFETRTMDELGEIVGDNGMVVLDPVNADVHWLHLTETVEWFVETPVIVQVRDGQVE